MKPKFKEAFKSLWFYRLFRYLLQSSKKEVQEDGSPKK